MRTKFTLALVPALTVLALAVAPAGSGAKTAPIKIKCKGHFVNQNPGKLKGSAVGMVKCSSPLGKGIQVTDFTETLSTSGAVTASGPTKAWYDLGTFHGTYKLAGMLVGATANLHGTAKVLGGTGAYNHAKGTGKISCVTKDAGVTYDCSYALTLARL